MSSPWGGSRPDPAAVGVSASAWPGRSLSSGRRRAATSSPAPTTLARPHSTAIVSLAPAVAPPTTTAIPALMAIPTPTIASASPTTGGEGFELRKTFTGNHKDRSFQLAFQSS
ncbi:hypothetical protein Cni_G10854 [Canna indica]|uniref:Uncharacterized protein n=1 Tax=Canna indica TaxID=4628 RepID=A0AAQ3K6S1_9LILI|nr:hypothetical protein Cni_G10854 [Canna indica]